MKPELKTCSGDTPFLQHALEISQLQLILLDYLVCLIFDVL